MFIDTVMLQLVVYFNNNHVTYNWKPFGASKTVHYPKLIAFRIITSYSSRTGGIEFPNKVSNTISPSNYSFRSRTWTRSA